MKRNTSPSLEDAKESGDKDTIIAVTRALQILEAFSADDSALTLAELSRRVGMGKSEGWPLFVKKPPHLGQPDDF